MQLLQVRVSPALNAALKRVAAKEMLPVALYVRRVLAERVRAEGVDFESSRVGRGAAINNLTAD